MAFQSKIHEQFRVVRHRKIIHCIKLRLGRLKLVEAAFYISLAAILFTIKKIDNMSEIKQVITHPAIGVARVGNSPDEYFLLPDLIDEPITDPGNSMTPKDVSSVRHQPAVA